MNIEDFIKKYKSDLKSIEKIQNCKLDEIKDSENKEKFNFVGVYLLVDSTGNIVYVGSAYARTVRSRLLQYQQKIGTGNNSLCKDLIEGKKCTEKNIEKYMKNLVAYSFEDESTEYRLIQDIEGVVNLAGKK